MDIVKVKVLILKIISITINWLLIKNKGIRCDVYEKLTKSQAKVFDFLKESIADGITPSVREICLATGLSSTSTVHSHLKSLEELGYITRTTGLNRSIRIVGEEKASQVPVIGKVTAGVPILAFEDISGYVPFPESKRKGRELFALNVVGESMKDIGILDGDVVICEKNLLRKMAKS